MSWATLYPWNAPALNEAQSSFFRGSHSTIAEGAAPSLSPVGSSSLYYELDDNTLKLSVSGGAWATLTAGAATPSGWTDDGTVVRLTTVTDQVGIGTAAPVAGSALEVVGRTRLTVPDNSAIAFDVLEGANTYFQVVTTNAAESVTIGNATTNPVLTLVGRPDVQLPDNTSGAFIIREAATANEYLTIDTTNALERITLGERTGTTASSAQIHLHIDNNIADAFLVRDNSRTYFSVASSTGTINIGSSSSTPINLGNGAAINCEIQDNDTVAFVIQDPAANDYISIRTSNGTESIVIGNNVTDPDISFLSEVQFNDSFLFNVPITPAALSTGGTTNNYAPAGFAGSNVVILTVTTGGGHTLTGLVPPADANLAFLLLNGSTAITDTITLTHDDAASTAANRFLLPADVALVIPAQGGIWLWYHAAVDRWRTAGGGV